MHIEQPGRKRILSHVLLLKDDIHRAIDEFLEVYTGPMEDARADYVTKVSLANL